MSPKPTHPSPSYAPAPGEGGFDEGRFDEGRSGEGLFDEDKAGRGRVLRIGSSVLAAVLLTVVFWHPLWTGGGLVGSDIYAYYLPQKAYFAESLRAGALPLWNNLVGHGYPLVAESQTGVFYPLHWALYPLFELNTAFSASIIAHYVLAFSFTCLFARRIGLTSLGAALAALVYTYGWFPPRVCLEWSITGGAWLPLALWCSESFLQTRLWRFALLLTPVLAMQMLAGHFMLAFITQLTLLLYVPLRLWFAAGDLPKEFKPSRRATCGGLALAVGAAYFVAAVQLLPTWELKRLSQRQSVSQEHDPGYGYIPPRYLTQIALPWVWYPEEKSFTATVTPGASRTNRVEAHLYFGLIPLGLIFYGLWCSRKAIDRRLAVWMILGSAALIYTTGWLLPVTKHLPGFSFFEGPGRFGVVTTLAAGFLAGAGFVELTRRSSRSVRWLLTIAIFGGTILDLFVVSRIVTFAFLVSDPPANHLAASPLRRYFADRSQPSRIFSEAKNLPSLLGTATEPVYLGLGPAEYFDPELNLRNPLPYSTPPTKGQLDWFHRAGVTHFLSFGPADERRWSARLVWQGADLFLNRALGRPADEQFYLYEIAGGRGRISWEGSASNPSASVIDYRPNEVSIAADSHAGGELVLTDLAYPGWNVSVDGVPGQPLVADKMFRGVKLSPGKHAVIWTYRPTAVYWGAGMSILMVLILMAVAHVRYWHPRIFERKSTPTR